MTWVAVAVVGGAAIGAIGSNMAANTQAGAAENSANLQYQMFNQQYQNQQPYVQAGQGAQSELNYLLGIGSPSQYGTPAGGVGGGGRQGFDDRIGWGIGAAGGMSRGLTAGSAAGGQPGAGFGSLLSPFTMDTFKQYSPAYQFQKQQGMQGVLNADTSGSGALSGAAQKDLIGFNQGLASTAFNNAFNQYQTQQGNIYSRLAGVAQIGQAAASNQATGASNFGASIGQQVANVGTAQAGGIVGATNSLGSIASLPWLTAGAGGPSNSLAYGNNAGATTPEAGWVGGI